MTNLPLGKLPPELLTQILNQAPIDDPRLILGPGIGLDCAVVMLGDACLVLKSDPITFATDNIGWYAVQVNANDIATCGAVPRWFLATILLPEEKTTAINVEDINKQIFNACRSLEISVIGGHTEITYGLERPIIAGTMIGEVALDRLITPKGASPGDRILLTKGIPIEGTAILAREFPDKLKETCTADEIQMAANYLHNPGISVVRDAHLAIQTGQVTAMHDPTEGGLAGALWEMAEACGYTLIVEPHLIKIDPISQKICKSFGINPIETIASGALLIVSPLDESPKICSALQKEGVSCCEIGIVREGRPQVLQSTSGRLTHLPRPERDEIARIFGE